MDAIKNVSPEYLKLPSLSLKHFTLHLRTTVRSIERVTGAGTGFSLGYVRKSVQFPSEG